MTALFLVRAQAAGAAVKTGFGLRRRDERLAHLLKRFVARRAWRGWSAVEPSVHHVLHEFDRKARAQASIVIDTAC